MPLVAIPGTAVTTATAGLFPDSAPQAPLTLDSSIGKAANVDQFSFEVHSVTDAGDRYRCRFDQRQSVLHPSWTSDTLEVVDIVETNNGAQPFAMFAPSAADVTVFDDQKIGYPATGLDIRQSADVMDTNSTYDIAPGSGSNLILGPGGKIEYAVIASVAKGHSIASVMVNVPAGRYGYANSAGAAITYRR